MHWLNILLMLVVGLVVLALVGGFTNMIRGGKPATSQKFMRWRVGLQLLAFAIALAILLLGQGK